METINLTKIRRLNRSHIRCTNYVSVASMQEDLTSNFNKLVCSEYASRSNISFKLDWETKYLRRVYIFSKCVEGLMYTLNTLRKQFKLLASICKAVHFIKILHDTVHISINYFIFKHLSSKNVTKIVERNYFQ